MLFQFVSCLFQDVLLKDTTFAQITWLNGRDGCCEMLSKLFTSGVCHVLHITYSLTMSMGGKTAQFNASSLVPTVLRNGHLVYFLWRSTHWYIPSPLCGAGLSTGGFVLCLGVKILLFKNTSIVLKPHFSNFYIYKKTSDVFHVAYL